MPFSLTIDLTRFVVEMCLHPDSASMIRVLSTSNGVVSPAAMPPEIAPQIATETGVRGRPVVGSH